MFANARIRTARSALRETDALSPSKRRVFGPLGEPAKRPISSLTIVSTSADREWISASRALAAAPNAPSKRGFGTLGGFLVSLLKSAVGDGRTIAR
jgi:hypothetical protein